MRQAFASLALIITALVFHTASWPQQETAGREHTLTGIFRTHQNFHSKILNNDRDVIVYLPPGYDAEKHQRYPVLYLHDGQNLFDGATSYISGMEWRVDETAQALIEAKAIRPLIIVGVYNTGKDRMDEYTPTKSERYKAGGRADLYGRMLVEELKPFIDSQYRTLRDAPHTGLGGSSLGGLVSLYLGLKYPQTFGKLAVVSPSVWWDNKAILRDVATLPRQPHQSIWLDIGTMEGSDAAGYKQTTDDARELRETLISKGWKENSDLKYLEVNGAAHNEQAWSQRVEPMLRFLFPKK